MYLSSCSGLALSVTFGDRFPFLSLARHLPSAGGSLAETHWFYERARGQYANAQTKMTDAQKLSTEFEKENPGTTLKFITLSENQARAKITMSTAMGGTSAAERNLDRLTVTVGLVWFACIISLLVLYRYFPAFGTLG